MVKSPIARVDGPQDERPLRTPNPPRCARRLPPFYRMGCPVWASTAWRGNLYSAQASPRDFLAEYCRVFGCVEGNSTFYALPTRQTVDRWREATPEGFHFCFKFPRSITHDRSLVEAPAETDAFLGLMERLPQRLGPLLLQLPPTFGPHQLPALDRYLESLPPRFTYAVEVRHPDLFETFETELTSLLEDHGVARGLMDTRAVHAAPARDPTTVLARSRKPKVPWRTIVTADTPFARIIGQNDVRATTGYLDQWAKTVDGWLSRGWSPYIFFHAPNDYYAPRLARAFHFLLRRRRPELPEHPAWPGEQSGDPQLGLL